MAFEMEGCCCCSLKAGTITIGIVESIISFMVLVLSAAYAENSHELVSMADPSVVPQTQRKSNLHTFSGLSKSQNFFLQF